MMARVDDSAVTPDGSEHQPLLISSCSRCGAAIKTKSCPNTM
jgi:hypothetical protein